MYNNKLVYTMITLGVLELLSLLIGVYFIYFTETSLSAVFIALSISHSILHSAFFVILMVYQRYQERYVILGAVTILILVTFQFVFINYLDHFTMTSMFADANIILVGVMLFVSMLIGVDDTTYSFVKRIIIFNALILLVFKTPIFFVTVHLVDRFFNSTSYIVEPVWISLITIQYVLFAILNGFKIKMFNRIDFV